MTPVYLDCNATTPLLPEVVDAMLPYLREHFGNPSSGHVYGVRARTAVERARQQVAELLGSAADEILFTSGGTEACNLALRGVTEALFERRHLIASCVEHPAVAEPCRRLQRDGWRVDWIGVDHEGRVRVDALSEALEPQTALVTVMHANNETGVLQPVSEIAARARRVGVLVYTDAAQSAGKVFVDVNKLGVDLLSIAGHKLHAPKGVGALYVRSGTPLRPLLLGAGHERGLRPGTENVASIVGLGVACELARRDMRHRFERMQAARLRLWRRLKAAVSGLELHGHPSERLPNTLNVRFPRVRGSALLAATPQVAASTGSACHAGGEAPSAILLAMGLSAEQALGAIRLSVGIMTTDVDVDQAALALSDAWRRCSTSA